MYIAPLSTRTSPLLTSLHFKIKSLHINHVSSSHITTLHITSLIYTQSPFWIPLLVTTFLILFLNVFSLQGKDASKLAGNWFQLLVVLFMKGNLPTSVLCFLVLIFRLWLLYSDSMVLEFWFLLLSKPVCQCMPWEKGACSDYQSSLCQSFPTRLIYIICKFSRSVLHPN